jgi:hypothetical protein
MLNCSERPGQNYFFRSLLNSLGLWQEGSSETTTPEGQSPLVGLEQSPTPRHAAFHHEQHFGATTDTGLKEPIADP